MEEFSNEWEKILVLSAIMFAGAMAFLAVPIPSVPGTDNSPNDSNQGDDNSASNSKPSIITSFGSLCGILCCVFSIASMVSAVNLKRDYGGKIKVDVHEVRKYLQSLNNGILGYLQWAICVSLPRALFQWAVISFCVGVIILAFQLHQARFNFFYAEISISIALLLGIVAIRGVSPDRIRQFRLRRALKFVGQVVEKAGEKILNWSRQKKSNRLQQSPMLERGLQIAPMGSGSGTPAASSS